MTFGIRDLRKAAKGYEIVRCNNCEIFYYDEIHDERDDNALEFIWDEDCKEFFKGCRKCRTDGYLIDIESEYLGAIQAAINVIHAWLFLSWRLKTPTRVSRQIATSL